MKWWQWATVVGVTWLAAIGFIIAFLKGAHRNNDECRSLVP